MLAYDPAQPSEAFTACGAERAELAEMLPQADILTIHCPEMPATYQLIGREQLAQLKRGAYMLNLARASIVDDDAFYEALVAGHIAGAGLDVFRDEPVQPDNRFARLPNVLVAPHLGGATRDVVRHQTDMIVEGIEAWLRGERPRSSPIPPSSFAGHELAPRLPRSTPAPAAASASSSIATDAVSAATANRGRTTSPPTR